MAAKSKKKIEPKVIRPDDIDPHHNWSRPVQAPGHMQVDFEERVNFRRLHDYRLARVRAALSGSGLGALLAKIEESGVDREFQRQVQELLKPGTSELFLVVENVTPDAAVDALSRFGGTVLAVSLSKEAGAELQAELGGTSEGEYAGASA